MLENLGTLAFGALVGAFYAAAFFALRRREGEDFEPPRFLATVLIGLFVGFVGARTGDAVTIANVETRLLPYGAAVIALEKIIKEIGVLDWLRGLFKKAK